MRTYADEFPMNFERTANKSVKNFVETLASVGPAPPLGRHLQQLPFAGPGANRPDHRAHEAVAGDARPRPGALLGETAHWAGTLFGQIRPRRPTPGSRAGCSVELDSAQPRCASRLT